MALIKCPECGKEISDKAPNCIHCGYPMNNPESEVLSPVIDNTSSDSSTHNPVESYTGSTDSKKKNIGCGCITAITIFFIIIIIIIILGSRGSSRRSSYPSTYNEAFKEYQNGNKAPLENFYSWLEKNP